MLCSFISGCAGTNFLLLKPETNKNKVIYLTFDDGPNGVATGKTLDVLKKYNVRAAFFVIGKNVEREPDIVRRMIKEGHTVGNHSYGVGNLLAFQSSAKIKENLKKTNQIIFKTSGYQPKYFRPPNGLMTKSLQKSCEDLNLFPVGVHIYVNDSFMNDANKIAKKIISRIKDSEYIIVLHDGFGHYPKPSRTIIADTLEIIITDLNKQGYRWGTIEEKFKK